jgi:hypothetical protein
VISHEIIVAKVPEYKYKNNKMNTVQYREYLDSLHVLEGSYVVYKTQAQVTHITQVHHIYEIQEDVEKVNNPYGEPQCLKAIQCGLMDTPPWCRWTSADHFRVITDEEYESFVRPNLDILQNSFKKYNAANS